MSQEDPTYARLLAACSTMKVIRPFMTCAIPQGVRANLCASVVSCRRLNEQALKGAKPYIGSDTGPHPETMRENSAWWMTGVDLPSAVHQVNERLQDTAPGLGDWRGRGRTQCKTSASDDFRVVPSNYAAPGTPGRQGTFVLRPRPTKLGRPAFACNGRGRSRIAYACLRSQWKATWGPQNFRT